MRNQSYFESGSFEDDLESIDLSEALTSEFSQDEWDPEVRRRRASPVRRRRAARVRRPRLRRPPRRTPRAYRPRRPGRPAHPRPRRRPRPRWPRHQPRPRPPVAYPYPWPPAYPYQPPAIEPHEPAAPASEYVRWLQSALNQVMGLRLPVDGIIGPETRSAIRDFQRREGLPVDGIAGPETKQALIAARRGPPPAPSDAPPAEEEEQFLGSPASYFTGPRRYPSRTRAQRPRRSQPQARVDRTSREYVQWVQGSLNRILRLQLAVDGALGPLTRSAIRGFQQKHGLAVDGVVGPRTEAALIRAGAGNPPGSRAPSHTPPPAPPPPPTSARGLRQKVAQLAVQEWQRWGRGTIKECDPGIRPVLEDYWRTGVGFVPSQSNYCSRVAWSAAFISWVMRQAGAGSAFKYSSAHTDYVGEAKRNRLANNSNPFKAYRIGEVAPRAGDLVCVERQDSNGNWSGVSYDNVDQGFRASHCDIVTEVRPGEIIAIGGNVSDSVSDKTIKTDANGRVRVPRYYAVVRVGA